MIYFIQKFEVPNPCQLVTYDKISSKLPLQVDTLVDDINQYVRYFSMTETGLFTSWKKETVQYALVTGKNLPNSAKYCIYFETQCVLK